MNEAVRTFAGWLRREDGFTLISHVSPDGDTIGSSLALFGMLAAMGKRVQAVCEQPVPRIYSFLPYAEKVLPPDRADAGYRNAVSVDCADEARMGNALDLFKQAEQKGNIDHHRTNPLFGDFVLHSEAAATGEIVYALWRELNVAADGAAAKEIAECLFTAISTDTGNFAYANTTPSTFLTAAGLLETGIDIASINRKVYRTVPLAKKRLLGYILTNMELYEDGRIGYGFVSLGTLDALGATAEEVDGVIDDIRDIDTVEIAILAREAKDGTSKVSMRSKQYADVSAIAHSLGGGGHIHAAGCTWEGAPEGLKAELLRLAKDALE
ncbi:MAG TPA: DHH family phosphoesterase [Feifaniaceae bacterium]|nr:DHH family phosphoesterase [Feifaniaceae bacterium]